MLVGKKFIYINLPRCASTSFHMTCLKNNVEIEHVSNFMHRFDLKCDFNDTNENIVHYIAQTHEKLTDLKIKFGTSYPVIAVKRNAPERWYSLWKHVLDEISKLGQKREFEILSSLTTDQLFTFTKNDILTDRAKHRYIDKFLKMHNLKISEMNNANLLGFLFILLSPTSYYHNYDKNIIWFDFEKLNELEEWVSNQLNTEFKLEKVNSSQQIQCNVKFDNHFIEKYLSIYGDIDNPKEAKTIL